MKCSKIVLLLPFFVMAANGGEIQVTRTDDGFQFREGEKQKILFYQRRPKSLDGKFERANYVHPLYDLDGNVLTEDFPEDHRHHRGIFWAWHQVLVGDQKAGDSWVARDFVWDVQDANVTTDDGESAALDVKVIWKSPRVPDASGQPKPLVEELTTIRVYRAQANSRKIDFEIRLLALQPHVRIGGSEDVKGYGGFSPRIRLPRDIRFIGQLGELAPKTTAVEGGAWLDMTARFGDDNSTGGVAILCHPTLPGFPQPWILRSRRSMQNPVYPGREPVGLSTDTPLVLRYRMVVHRGKTDPDAIERWQQEYASDAIDFAPTAEFPKLPDSISLGPCSAIAVNSKNQIYLAHRGKQPIICLDANGHFLRAWGDDSIDTVHGLRIDDDDNVWITDIGNHTVRKFSPNGKPLITLGRPGKAGPGIDQFNKPTDIAFGPDGEIYVSDGYGNSRVSVFSPNGGFLNAWGTPGKDAGEFDLPHCIIRDRGGRILVGDRENNRIQVFTTHGELLDIWNGFAPYGIDCDRHGNLFVADGRANKVLQLDSDGDVIRSWGGKGKGPGQFQLPHMLAVDAEGNLYVAEVDGKRFQKMLKR